MTRTRLLLAAVCVTLAGASSLEAAVVVYLWESGSDVKMSASGTVNTSALTDQGTYVSTSTQTNGGLGLARIGTDGTSNSNRWTYSGSYTEATFGTNLNTITTPDAGSQAIGVSSFQNSVFTPVGYTSGTSLSASATWSSKTLAGMSVNTGDYVWRWDIGGAEEDSLTLHIGTEAPAAAVPEPSSLALLGMLGSIGLVGHRLRRRKKRKTTEP